jgi:hypothetical protein
MKKRCNFILAMCGMSLYNWYNYSLFDPVVNDFFTPYYQNCLLMLFYLGWDTYHMTLSNNRKILYRTDLIIHHIFCLIGGISYINNTSLQFSHFMICECISLMNYYWRNNHNRLNLYRKFCIFCIRIPLSLWFWLYYNPYIGFPYLKQTRPYYHYLYLFVLLNQYWFFIAYDIFILWKINKIQR